MKIMIASDLHGSSFYTEKLMCRYETEKADKLLLLGDILYHSSMSFPTEHFDRGRVISLLNYYSDSIICIRGNCDSTMDENALYFDMEDFKTFDYKDRTIYATHGHFYGEYDPPRLKDGDILLTGHTHVPAFKNHGFYYLNPGSVSLPKRDSWHGYMTFSEGLFIWKDIEGNEKMSFNMEDESFLTK